MQHYLRWQKQNGGIFLVKISDNIVLSTKFPNFNGHTHTLGSLLNNQIYIFFIKNSAKIRQFGKNSAKIRQICLIFSHFYSLTN